MKTFLTIATLAVAGISLAACETNPAHKAPGTYKSSTYSEGADGTTYRTDKETNVTVDRYGNKKAVVETETKTDPKGLFNSSTSKSERTYVD